MNPHLSMDIQNCKVTQGFFYFVDTITNEIIYYNFFDKCP